MEPLLTRSVAIVFLSPEEAGNSGGRHGRAHQSKPEPDTPLLKNKVNHNMCSGLFKKQKKNLPCKRGEGETSFSCSIVIFWLTEKVDVVHLFDTRQDLCFLPFLYVFVLKGFPQLALAFSESWHKSRTYGLFWLVGFFFTSLTTSFWKFSDNVQCQSRMKACLSSS